MLPDDLNGKDAIELGCGTAYVSSWLVRKGARVVAIDNSSAQLATARRLQTERGLNFPLIHGNAESVAYPNASFNFAISEYGACLWADPQRWVPEAARLLRGQLVLFTNWCLMALCTPPEEDLAATDRLLRPACGMYRIEWPNEPGVEFHLSHGDWIRLLRQSALRWNLMEVRPSAEATTRYPYVTLEWARQWPSEELWKVRESEESIQKRSSTWLNSSGGCVEWLHVRIRTGELNENYRETAPSSSSSIGVTIDGRPAVA